MGEENIRRRVVSSFRKAIDFEQQCNDVEAYRNYLEGLALVAAALQQDAESSWTLGNPSLTSKERRSLVGFAKQSVDRLILLLDKRDHDPSSVFKETTQVTDNEGAKQNYKDFPTQVMTMQKPSALTPSPQKGTVRKGEACEKIYNSRCEESPITRMHHENKLLVARYSSRLQSATTAIQRQNLQLELERRLTENLAIARQQQEAWEHRRTEIAARCHKVAEVKFQINEKIENGTITETDFKKQRVFAAAIQYEEENLWLKKMKEDILFQPEDEKLQRDVIGKILFDRSHPLGCLLCQMQNAVINKVNPIINKHQALLITRHTLPRYNTENLNDTRHEVLSGIHRDLLNLSLDDAVGNQSLTEGTKFNAHYDEEEIAQEEQKAFHRHFQNIAIDIKKDIKFLEILLITLIEPLSSEKGRAITTDLLHQIYFAPIKSYLIMLLRLSLHREECELESVLSEKDNKDMIPVEEDIRRKVCAMLQHLTTLHSPCQMLDSLVAALRVLASTSDENNQCKSLGADDLLPRLMTVILSSGLPTLLAEAMYMENFMPTDKALGEGGYSLTVLQSVMSCLLPHSG